MWKIMRKALFIMLVFVSKGTSKYAAFIDPAICLIIVDAAAGYLSNTMIPWVKMQIQETRAEFRYRMSNRT
jgi:hypothetical protein